MRDNLLIELPLAAQSFSKCAVPSGLQHSLTVRACWRCAAYYSILDYSYPHIDIASPIAQGDMASGSRHIMLVACVLLAAVYGRSQASNVSSAAGPQAASAPLKGSNLDCRRETVMQRASSMHALVQ